VRVCDPERLQGEARADLRAGVAAVAWLKAVGERSGT